MRHLLASGLRALVLLTTSLLFAESADATCPTVCVNLSLPIKILVLGDDSGTGALIIRARLTDPDCDACGWVEGTDFTLTTLTNAAALAASASHYQTFDVIAFASPFYGVSDPALAAAPWQPVVASSYRAVVTGVHIDGHDNQLAFNQLTKNIMVWLANDECFAAGSPTTPGVLALTDNTFPAPRYSYLPWAGIGVSSPVHPPSCNLVATHDNATNILAPLHPIFDNVTDTNDVSCPPADCRSLDMAGGSNHMRWQSGLPGGFESDGFTSLLRANWIPVNQATCPDAANTVGDIMCGGVPFGGHEALLVREVMPPRVKCTGDRYLPFFREDGGGIGSCASYLALVNRNLPPIDVLVHFYNALGHPLYRQQNGCSGYPVSLPGNGNAQAPTLVSHIRLSTVFNQLPIGGTQIGSIVLETIGSSPSHEEVKYCAAGRLYVLDNNGFLNNPDGFSLLSQNETSTDLFADFVASMPSGTGLPLALQEILCLQNPQVAACPDEEYGPELTAAARLDFYDIFGNPTPGSGVTVAVPPNGIALVQAANMSGLLCPPNDGITIQGNAVVNSIPNEFGKVLPLVGVAVNFDGGTCGDPFPTSSSEHPKLGVDLRTDTRK